MLHHEDSPEKPQHNMATSLFLDKLPIMPYTLSFLGKYFRPPPTPLHPHFHKFWKSRLHNGGTGNLKIFIVYWCTMHWYYFLTQRAWKISSKLKPMCVPCKQELWNLMKKHTCKFWDSINFQNVGKIFYRDLLLLFYFNFFSSSFVVLWR